MSIEYILLYAITVFVASITPGPSMILALNSGIKFGLKKSCASALGNSAATFLQALMSIAGLTIILNNSEFFYNIIKYLGTLYLIFIGVKMFLSEDTFVSSKEEEVKEKYKFNKLFIEAFVVTIGNPKAIVFFTALFPQFIKPETYNFFNIFIIIFMLLLIAFLCMMIYSYFGERLKILIEKSKLKKYLNKIFGITFIISGLSLAQNKIKR